MKDKGKEKEKKREKEKEEEEGNVLFNHRVEGEFKEKSNGLLWGN